MRKLFFLEILMLFTVTFAYSQNVTNIEVKQVSNTIEISFSLDKKAYITINVSIDGGSIPSPIVALTSCL